MTLWLIGKFVADTDLGTVWEFQGIVSSRDTAIKACPTWEYFVAPVEIGHLAPHETTGWIGLEYPIVREEATQQ